MSVCCMTGRVERKDKQTFFWAGFTVQRLGCLAELPPLARRAFRGALGACGPSEGCFCVAPACVR
jgi:hypothetical protein